jgi:hypothetical protein
MKTSRQQKKTKSDDSFITDFKVCPFTKCYLTQEQREAVMCKWSIRTEHGEADCGYG